MKAAYYNSAHDISIGTALAEAGADIVGISRSLESAGREIRNAVEAAGRKFHDYSVDFSRRTEIYRFIDRLLKDGPTIDVVANDAGHIPHRPASEHPDEYWEELIEAELNSQIVLSCELGERMVERRSGKIIFTDSPHPIPGGMAPPVYAAASGVIGQLTKSLANEWAPYNAQVNAITPGYVTTDHTATLRADPAHNSSIRTNVPAGRWGTPEDFEGVTVLLAASASEYLSGSIIVVDRGWMGRQELSDHAASAESLSPSSARVGAYRHYSPGTRSGT